MTGTDLRLDGPHWSFICEVYGAPEVQEACLALQDNLGVDLSFLLTLLWFAKAGHGFDPAEVEVLDHLVEPWRRDVVKPLRAIRRVAKSAAATDAAIAGWRERIKAAEVEAEQIEIAMLVQAIAARGAAAANASASTVTSTAESVVAVYADGSAAPARRDFSAEIAAIVDAVARTAA
jgi:uncharacterized protein (TIGR02444 family)